MMQIPNDLFFKWVEEELAAGHHVRFRLKGYSMLPFLRNEKDDVVLYPCTEAELSPMDVVLFRYKGKHLLHRIIRKEGKELLIQGDGSFYAKERCAVDDVVGKLKVIIRPSGKSLPVESLQWRLYSQIWLRIGCLRSPLLRIFHFIYR